VVPDDRETAAHRATDEAREALRDDIAARVMGWTSGRVAWAYDGAAMLWHSADGIPLLPRDAWRPDQNDAQAMQVLERMVELGFDYVLGSSGGRTFAAFEGPDGGSERVEHPERRIALLRAALSALGAGADPSPGPG
jgi:hypothetical protein